MSSADAEDSVLYEATSTGVAIVTFNRPDRLNAPTIGMRLLYGDLIHRANIDDEVKVLVVLGGPMGVADVGNDSEAAARKVLGYLDAGGDPRRLIEAARLLIFLKGNNAHDYKFSSAALEDYYHLGPRWRPYFLAATMFQLRGSGQADNELIRRTREALG